MLNFANAGKTLEVVDTHVVALYDAETGRIAHVHTVTVFKGGSPVTEKEAIEAARKVANKSGVKTDRLKIKVSKDAAHGRGPHRIDVASGNFLPLPAHKRKA